MASMPLSTSNENTSYTTTPWSSVKCYSTGINNHCLTLTEVSCMSAECDMNIPSLPNDVASIAETTILSPNLEDSNINEHNCTRMQTHLPAPSFSIPSLPVHGEPKTGNDEDQDGDISSGVKVVDSSVAKCDRREFCLVRAAAAAKYKCATQTHGCTEIRIGWDGEIPRWRRGSEISYVVCIESFPAPLSSMVEDSMKAATGMWNDIGVSFKQVARNDPATFAVIYENRNRNAYACSFFPNELSRELIIYPPSLQTTNYLSNILAHEVGHILGLRHEFAHEREEEYPSALFGSENADSIMNYFDHPERLQVREQDLEELERFYAYDKVKYGKLSILDVHPEVWFFGKIMVMNHDICFLNCANKTAGIPFFFLAFQ
ncbi:hypothetical protein J3E68DRAFT_427895 [Trichoderma sp. SZMC 28012]